MVSRLSSRSGACRASTRSCRLSVTHQESGKSKPQLPIQNITTNAVGTAGYAREKLLQPVTVRLFRVHEETTEAKFET